MTAILEGVKHTLYKDIDIYKWVVKEIYLVNFFYILLELLLKYDIIKLRKENHDNYCYDNDYKGFKNYEKGGKY